MCGKWLFYAVAVLVPIFLLAAQTSYADTTLVGLQLSQACIKLLETNTTSHCISYDKLKPFEKVNPLLAGKWTAKPYVHKVYANFMGVWKFPSLSNVTLIDPPGDFQLASKMIIIQADNFTWTDANDFANNTQYIQHLNRFVFHGCNEAKVAPIMSLINDTIRYLQSGCRTTNYNDIQIIHRAQAQFSSDNPYSSLHYHSLVKSLKHTSIPDCIHHKCDYKDPYAKRGW